MVNDTIHEIVKWFLFNHYNEYKKTEVEWR